ncbi:MAG: Uma2 family endonuclease [Spirulinaceae cyanobacterium]
MIGNYTINFAPLFTIDDEKFALLCRHNPGIKFERNHQGELIIMAPTGGESGIRNTDLTGQFWLWNRQNKLGKVFDSSTCFRLPNGANLSPDVSWIKQARWDKLTPQQKATFPPLAPDFVLELMSPSDNLKDTQKKMQEYLDAGVKLGWLINPKKRQVEIYRLGQDKEVLAQPTILSGEDILPGFILDLQTIWE